MNKRFYITTPIYYPNAQPHVGTLYSTLLADVAARYHALAGKKTFFLTGTDEHGQKIQERAEAAGKAPKAFVDEIVPAFKSLWDSYNIIPSRFIRTTDQDHEFGVVQWIEKVMAQGDIYKSSYTGWYCVPCETFVNTGSEPITDEKGNFVCPNCKRGLKQIEEESYFFRLSAYQDKLLAFYEQNPDFIAPRERLAEVVSFVKAGLKDLSISRKSVSWGIPFPGDSEHTVYVWADALNNYVTGIGYGQQDKSAQDLFKTFWPADAHMMAKDIVRFHAVYWPAFLMAAELELPKKLVVHGYLLTGDTKMSKSLGNAFDPFKLRDLYGVDQVRYYLTRHMAITHDGNFDLADLEEKVGAELANAFSNLLNRALTLALSHNAAILERPQELEARSAALLERVNEAYKLYCDEMDKFYFHTAYAEVFKFIGFVNAYFHELEPWKLAKTNPALFAESLWTASRSLHMIGIMLQPVIPHASSQLLSALGAALELGTDYDALVRTNQLQNTYTLTKIDPLFTRPEKHSQALMEQKKAVVENNTPEAPVLTIDDVVKVHLVVGKIIHCEAVPNSDKLLKLDIDAGEYGKRQILSGVAKDIKPDDLIGRNGVFIANLPPRKMAGFVSEGMMLYGTDSEGKLKLCTVEGAAPGARVK